MPTMHTYSGLDYLEMLLCQLQEPKEEAPKYSVCVINIHLYSVWKSLAEKVVI